MDIVDPTKRSRMMAGIRGRDTKPEITLRRSLHARGFRFRLGNGALPGRPDIVLPRWKAAIQVHGCFWHRHSGCRFATVPASNAEFWATKFAANVERDARKLDELMKLGWRVAVVWECGLRANDLDPTVDPLVEWLRSDTPFLELPKP